MIRFEAPTPPPPSTLFQLIGENSFRRERNPAAPAIDTERCPATVAVLFLLSSDRRTVVAFSCEICRLWSFGDSPSSCSRVPLTVSQCVVPCLRFPVRVLRTRPAESVSVPPVRQSITVRRWPLDQVETRPRQKWIPSCWTTTSESSNQITPVIY